jgi:hypothetical protein
MSLLSRFKSRAWILVPVCALAFTLWADSTRMRRVEFVSGIAAEGAKSDPSSPTGYAEGRRWLVVPEHHNPTYQWIEETELMLARGDWRLRSIPYENAPYGRPVRVASPYRWWLVGIAWVEHALSGRPLGWCVERAVLYADPAIHLLLLATGTLFVAMRFGAFCAAVFSVGLAALFPLASAYLPGVADDFGLEQACSLWSVLLLAAGTARRNRSYFLAAGAAGGFGLWVSAMGQAPVVAGIAAGGILAAFLARKRPTGDDAPLPWRAWAFGGAAASLLGYLIEYFPDHMEPQLRVNYPLYALAWLGLGELLRQFSRWARRDAPRTGLRDWIIVALSAAAAAALPVAIWRAGVHPFLTDDLLTARLTNLPDPYLPAWAGGGPGGALAAVWLSVLLLAPAGWFLAWGRSGAAGREATAVALGPALAALALSVSHPRWWSTFDAAVLGLAVAAAAAIPSAVRGTRWLWSALLAAAAASGALRLVPLPADGGQGALRLTHAEIEGIYERGLAHWIADRAGPAGATVLAPPFRTSSLCFYGGLRGIATQNWENADGMSAMFYIVTAMRQGESRSGIESRGVTHVVLFSWDTEFEDFARLRLKDPAASFVYAVHNTLGGGFSWLRPVPYELPPAAGLEDESVTVLETVDEADPATRQGRFVEYLLETRQMDQAVNAGHVLERYPADLGALAARAQLAKATGDERTFAKLFASIVSDLGGRSERSVPWDRRVSLAVVLAIGGRADLSRAQVFRCMREADAEHIRFLTTESLYHLLLVAKRAGADFPDPGLRALSLKLLPAKLRGRL